MKAILFIIPFLFANVYVWGQKSITAKNQYMPCSVTIQYYRTETTTKENTAPKGNFETHNLRKEYFLSLRTPKALLSTDDGTVSVEIDPSNDVLTKAGQVMLDGIVKYNVSGSDKSSHQCFSKTINSIANGEVNAKKMGMRFDYYPNKENSFSLSIDNNEEDVTGQGETAILQTECEKPNINYSDSTFGLLEKMAASSTFSHAFVSQNTSSEMQKILSNVPNSPSNEEISKAINIAEKYMTPEQITQYRKAIKEQRDKEQANEDAARQRTQNDPRENNTSDNNPQQLLNELGYGGVLNTIKTKNGFTITYYAEGKQYDENEKITSQYNTHLVVYISTKPLTTLKALIVPIDEDREKYEKWVPEGPMLPDVEAKSPEEAEKKQYNSGNYIKFKVILVNSNEPKVNISNQYRFTVKYFLRDVTSYKGYATNYPAKDGKSDLDLKFDKLRMSSDKFELIDEKKAITKQGMGNISEVNVVSYDYGSFGKLMAEVKIENEDIVLLAEDEKVKAKNYLTIPYDNNGNEIADKWEDDKNIYAKNLGKGSDEENEPNDYPKEGDGLTLLDEYRGIAGIKNQTSKVFRLNPSIREGFFQTKDSTKISSIRKGVKQFEKITSIYLYEIEKKEYLGKSKHNKVLFPNTVLNPNSEYREKYEIATVPIIAKETPNLTKEEANTNPALPFPETLSLSPEIVERLLLSSVGVGIAPEIIENASPNDFARSINQGISMLKDQGINIDPNTLKDLALSKIKDIKEQYYVYNVFHELCHAYGLQHHLLNEFLQAPTATVKEDFYSQGAKDCPIRYWYSRLLFPDEIIKFWLGLYDVSQTNASKQPYKICEICKSKIHFYEK